MSTLYSQQYGGRNVRIEHTLAPQLCDLDLLTQGINAESRHVGSAYSYAFFLKDEKDNIVGGCSGSVVFGEVYTDQLWVQVNYRRQGWGKQLMDRVHAYGREVGCTMATVCTMSFQNARSFYENLGYVCDFERQGYANGSSCLFLKKVL